MFIIGVNLLMCSVLFCFVLIFCFCFIFFSVLFAGDCMCTSHSFISYLIYFVILSLLFLFLFIHFIYLFRQRV